MLNRLLRWLGSLFKRNTNGADSKSPSGIGKNIYKNTYRLCWNYNAQASIFLWGTDGANNPAFTVLYANPTAGVGKTFTSYAIFRGAGGHFPSFDKVRIVEQYDHKTRQRFKMMYYAKDVGHSYYYYVRGSGKEAVKDFYPLDHNKQISFTPDPRLSYTDMLKRLNLSGLMFENFILAANPSDIMKLPPKLERYAGMCFELFSNTSLYLRRKVLNELINSNPPKELYQYMLKVGSGELLSGLFLELAKRKDPIMAYEAEILRDGNLNWLDEFHRKGLLRCASLYVDSLSDETRDERIRSLYENTFKPGNQDIIGFKNTVQTAEIYALSDILGKVASYLDTGKFTFVTKTNTKLYFDRYIRRIIDSYAGQDEEKFFEAIKSFLINYDKTDAASGYKPYFVNHYLYFNRQDRRCEFKPEIWDRHVEDVFDIMSVTRSDLIAGPLYQILFDNRQSLSGISYERLLAAAGVPYKPTADMLVRVIGDKLKAETGFNPELMIQLAQCDNAGVQQLASAYFSATGGKVSSATLVNFMFMRDLDRQTHFIGENIQKFNIDEYLEFVNSIYNSAGLFAKQNVVCPESLADILDGSVSMLEQASASQRSALAARVLHDLSLGGLKDYLIGFSEKIIFSIPLDELESVPFSCDISRIPDVKSVRICGLFMSIRDKDIPDDAFIADILENGSPGMVNVLGRLLAEWKEQLCGRFNTLILLLESGVASLNELAKDIFRDLPGEAQSRLHAMILDSPDEKTYKFGLGKLNEIYESRPIPAEYIKEMLEHPSYEVRSYVSDKVNGVMNSLGDGNADLFLYYAKTLLFLPNKVSTGKRDIYNMLPRFAGVYKEKRPAVEELLLDIGGSNIIADSERALVALARIKDSDPVEC